MDLSNTDLMDNDAAQQYSNFTFNDLFKKDTIKAGLFGGPAAAIAAANKKDKEKAKALAAENEAKIAAKNAEVAAAQSEAAKAKAEAEQAKADKISGSNVRLTDSTEGMSKSTKLALWIGGGVVALGLISFVVYKIVKK